MPRGQYIAGHAWTEEREQTLRRLWGDGESASFIARALGGLTRNAVIGKVHRLGLQPRARLRPRVGGAAACYAAPAMGGGMRAPSVPNHRQNDGAAGAGLNFRNGAQKPRRKDPVVLAAPLAEALAASVSWDQRLPNQCAWILGDAAGADSRCCGHAVDGGALRAGRAMYCAAHNAAAKAPQAPRPLRFPQDHATRRPARNGNFFGAGWMK